MGYRRDQKTQAPLPFLPLTLEKLQKNVYLKTLTTGPAPPPPPPFESATKAKASFFGKLILVIHYVIAQNTLHACSKSCNAPFHNLRLLDDGSKRTYLRKEGNVHFLHHNEINGAKAAIRSIRFITWYFNRCVIMLYKAKLVHQWSQLHLYGI